MTLFVQLCIKVMSLFVLLCIVLKELPVRVTAVSVVEEGDSAADLGVNIEADGAVGQRMDGRGTAGSIAAPGRGSIQGEHMTQRYVPEDLITIVQCVDCLARQGNRNYTVTEGTLLGTHRDGFLLPWDSDADISFDVNGPDGKEDLLGFYKLFTRDAQKKSEGKCPVCAKSEITLFHFIDNRVDGDVKLYYWQSYDDIVSGNLIVLHDTKTSLKRQVSEAVQKDFLKTLGKEKLNSRFKYITNPKGVSSYVDVEPAWVDTGVWQNLMIKVSEADALPFRRCEAKQYGEHAELTLSLSCAAKPDVLLEAYYGAGWKTPLYNAFVDSNWKYLKRLPDLKTFAASRLSESP